jgi:ABC-2 type transport system permease protein
MTMNLRAVRAIYRFEMARTGRTLAQSIVSPVISTSLYFVVFGAAMGSRITQIEGVAYGLFIVPGLIMLMLLTQSVANASFGIYFPRFTGTIFELLSAPISYLEIVIGYVGAAATKSIILGLIILGPTASRSFSSCRFSSSRRSPFSAARSTRSPCCRRSGRR